MRKPKNKLTAPRMINTKPAATAPTPVNKVTMLETDVAAAKSDVKSMGKGKGKPSVLVADRAEPAAGGPIEKNSKMDVTKLSVSDEMFKKPTADVNLSGNQDALKRLSSLFQQYTVRDPDEDDADAADDVNDVLVCARDAWVVDEAALSLNAVDVGHSGALDSA